MSMIFAIFLPIILAIFIPLLYKKAKRIHTGWFVLIAPLILVVLYALYIPSVMDGKTFSEEMPWIPSLDISLVSYIDGLSLLFSLLITGIGSLVVLYSIFYLDKDKENLGNFYVYLLMFMTAMLGVVQSDHLIGLYFFWELTSISSFLLIGYWYTRDRSRFGALKSMMITVFGGLMMLGGFLLLGIMGETFSIRELISQAATIAEHDLFVWALVLILLGAFTKSAQFPFYVWLPDAMEAPTPVSAYLHSATMVKAGLYLVARLTPIFALSEVWVWLVTGVGILTLFWGSFFAVKQTDLKAILAFSTVSQLGLIMSLLGIGSIAYHVTGDLVTTYTFATFAAIFHLLNHATFKGSLFMIAGIVDHETGTRDIRKLGGLMSLMPISFTIAMIGSLSMAGIPLFNGFLSKEMFLDATLSLQHVGLYSMDTWWILIPIVAWVASVFTFVYSLYFVLHTFRGKHTPELLPKKAHEAPIGMLISPGILATLVIVIFFIPNFVGNTFIKPAVAAIQPSVYALPSDVGFKIKAWHGFDSPALYMTLGIFLVGYLLYKTLPKWSVAYSKMPAKVTLNGIYDWLMMLSESGAKQVSSLYMKGSIRSYLIYIFGAIIILLASTLWIKEAFVISFDNLAPIKFFEVLLSLLIIIGTLTILITKSRLTAIIALGAVGYTVALFFIIFKAPDLALTQLVIETVSVALFLGAFYHLPKLNKHEKGKEDRKFRLTNFLIALGVGVMVSLIAISAHSQKLVPSISEYYKKTVYSEAGGGNIVNVILVDYRGFDTLFEIGVLTIASLGIIGMITLRLAKKKGENKVENK
ncbi:Na+/H+ antiporter subunit A [Psychrobacillus sp. BL-248-WT-3]|uniref:Na+/H+ antiporter subunit A n=1 Tax=Psychrobacillus sp. BL-248-WT-3 TaxID=2725306 RepID=UPI00146D3CDB|nr:Na+/H+ antiporter subunit A [Psychrobacillus sp. BL-248-WT-3]NME05940.1 Na+/H+ antiporter subunit A [Psychrobacillus sp. BL-248-WT-3]